MTLAWLDRSSFVSQSSTGVDHAFLDRIALDLGGDVMSVPDAAHAMSSARTEQTSVSITLGLMA